MSQRGARDRASSAGSPRRGARASSRDASRDPRRYDLVLSARGFFWSLAAAAAALLAGHLAINLYHHYRADAIPREPSAWPWLARQMLDVDQENNLPTWYSSMLLLTASVLLFLVARRTRVERRPWFRLWYVLAAGFLLLSIDEIAGIHETIHSAMTGSWTTPAAIVVGFIGLVYVPFLLGLPRRTAIGFVIGGILYLAGALVMERVGANFATTIQAMNKLDYNLLTLAEEGLEMAGVLVFIAALLGYMRRTGGTGIDTEVDVGVEVRR